MRKLVPGFRATSMGHVLSGLGKGADYIADYVNLYAAFDGTILLFQEWSGGNWIRVTRPSGDRIEAAHLHRYLVKNGQKVKEGELIAITGNTGKITTHPHLHLQVFVNNKRIDPETYDWKETIDIPGLFLRIWGKPGAPGDIKYFQKRLASGSITGADDLKAKLAYWHSIVYPGGILSPTGDARWQAEKRKVLG